MRMYGELLKILIRFQLNIQTKKERGKKSRKDVLRSHVGLKFMLMNHKYRERFCGKLKGHWENHFPHFILIFLTLKWDSYH